MIYGRGWQSVWEDRDRYLSRLSPPMALERSPEQVQNPKKVTMLEDACFSLAMPMIYSSQHCVRVNQATKAQLYQSHIQPRRN